MYVCMYVKIRRQRAHKPAAPLYNRRYYGPLCSTLERSSPPKGAVVFSHIGTVGGYPPRQHAAFAAPREMVAHSSSPAWRYVTRAAATLRESTITHRELIREWHWVKGGAPCSLLDL